MLWVLWPLAIQVRMDKFEREIQNEEPMNFNNSSNLSSDWPFTGPNLTNTSMGMVSSSNPLESSSCSSASMVDSFCHTIWDQPTNSQSLGYCDINLQNNGSSSSTLGFRKGNLGPTRTLDMSWNPSNPMLKGSMFLPTASPMLPQSLSQFPADSGFIERAARFSCFSAGNIGDMINPFGVPESLSPYSRGVAMQGPQDGFAGNGPKLIPGGEAQKNEMNMPEGSQDVSMTVGCGANGRQGETLARSHDEGKQGAGVSGNESDEAEDSDGGVGQEETSNKGLGSKKRRRGGQDNDFNQFKATPKPPGEINKISNEIQQKGDQNPTSVTNKSGGKHGKQGSSASDMKEEYIHVRARRGQATNSHSLAERVRREKISERMKFLQDLVPGCSKVTGKAVMLDEIINYVQSLQRQVEFLSMKLATVNPRLDFNMEGLLAKDILQSRSGPSATLGFPPEMTMPYPSLSQLQPGIIQTGLAGVGSSSDTVRRTINSHLSAISGGYKEPSSQVSNVWEDELHNIIQMGLNPNIPLTSQDLGSLPSGHLKAEP